MSGVYPSNLHGNGDRTNKRRYHTARQRLQDAQKVKSDDSSNQKKKDQKPANSNKTLLIVLVVMIVLTWSVAATAYFGIVDYKGLLTRTSNLSSTDAVDYISSLYPLQYDSVRHPFRTLGAILCSIDDIISNMFSFKKERVKRDIKQTEEVKVETEPKKTGEDVASKPKEQGKDAPSKGQQSKDTKSKQEGTVKKDKQKSKEDCYLESAEEKERDKCFHAAAQVLQQDKFNSKLTLLLTPTNKHNLDCKISLLKHDDVHTALNSTKHGGLQDENTKILCSDSYGTKMPYLHRTVVTGTNPSPRFPNQKLSPGKGTKSYGNSKILNKINIEFVKKSNRSKRSISSKTLNKFKSRSFKNFKRDVNYFPHNQIKISCNKHSTILHCGKQLWRPTLPNVICRNCRGINHDVTSQTIDLDSNLDKVSLPTPIDKFIIIKPTSSSNNQMHKGKEKMKKNDKKLLRSSINLPKSSIHFSVQTNPINKLQRVSVQPSQTKMLRKNRHCDSVVTNNLKSQEHQSQNFKTITTRPQNIIKHPGTLKQNNEKLYSRPVSSVNNILEKEGEIDGGKPTNVKGVRKKLKRRLSRVVDRTFDVVSFVSFIFEKFNVFIPKSLKILVSSVKDRGIHRRIVNTMVNTTLRDIYFSFKSAGRSFNEKLLNFYKFLDKKPAFHNFFNNISKFKQKMSEKFQRLSQMIGKYFWKFQDNQRFLTSIVITLALIGLYHIFETFFHSIFM